MTELILDNMLAAYEPEEVVALLSSFVFQEKTDVEPVIPDKLKTGQEEIIKLADRVGRRQLANKVSDPDFASKLKFGLVEVVYEWAKGTPFEQITGLTDVPEGTVVRVITRLDETCREVRDAARVIGDTELFQKMEAAQVKIKRDSKSSSFGICSGLMICSRICGESVFLGVRWGGRVLVEDQNARDLLCTTMSDTLTLGALGVRCPVLLDRLHVSASDEILSNGTRLLSWIRPPRKPGIAGERGEVVLPFGGALVRWEATQGTTINSADQPIASIERCKHPVEWGGLCASCGDEVGSYSVRLTHDAAGPTVSHEEAHRIELETAERLVRARKLSLIVDLDQTVVHATVDPTVGEWIAQGEPNPNSHALRDVKRFILADASTPDGCCYYIKPR